MSLETINKIIELIDELRTNEFFDERCAFEDYKEKLLEKKIGPKENHMGCYYILNNVEHHSNGHIFLFCESGEYVQLISLIDGKVWNSHAKTPLRAFGVDHEFKKIADNYDQFLNWIQS